MESYYCNLFIMNNLRIIGEFVIFCKLLYKSQVIYLGQAPSESTVAGDFSSIWLGRRRPVLAPSAIGARVNPALRLAALREVLRSGHLPRAETRDDRTSAYEGDE